MKPIRLRLTPPQTFTTVSLLLIVLLVLGITFTQSSFYGQAIIDRESVIFRDMVNAIALQQEHEHHLYPSDVERDPKPGVQKRLADTFGVLRKLSGVTLIKVFNRDKTIVWSSEPSLVGKYAVTRHPADLEKALGGEARAVFIQGKRTLETAYMFPRLSLIEFYVPFTLGKHNISTDGKPSGVLAIYRFPQELNRTIHHAIFLLWLVTGVGGAILFGALYTLFRSVYYRQREAESQFAKLSTQHQRLVQIEKLSAMGQLVSEIAHQLNNPLVGVINLAELAERETVDPKRTKELLGEIRKAGDHCRRFVQQMLRFNQVARSEPQLIEMKTLVRETIAFLRQSMTSNPVVTLEAPDSDVMLEVDPVLIRHALFNLLHNAVLASPGTPVLVSLASEEVRGSPGWCLSVADCGSGLTPEVKAKLFTPFFTTRDGGTGLGLSVAQHIVLQHGGSIRAENKPDGGALFVIWLPAIKER